jgi:hypothetical protein
MTGKTCDWKSDILSVVCLCQQVYVCSLSARDVWPQPTAIGRRMLKREARVTRGLPCVVLGSPVTSGTLLMPPVLHLTPP